MNNGLNFKIEDKDLPIDNLPSFEESTKTKSNYGYINITFLIISIFTFAIFLALMIIRR